MPAASCGRNSVQVKSATRPTSTRGRTCGWTCSVYIVARPSMTTRTDLEHVGRGGVLECEAGVLLDEDRQALLRLDLLQRAIIPSCRRGRATARRGAGDAAARAPERGSNPRRSPPESCSRLGSPLLEPRGSTRTRARRRLSRPCAALGAEAEHLSETQSRQRAAPFRHARSRRAPSLRACAERLLRKRISRRRPPQPFRKMRAASSSCLRLFAPRTATSSPSSTLSVTPCRTPGTGPYLSTSWSSSRLTTRLRGRPR